MSKTSEKKPIDGETEPVKCYYCRKWATNRGAITGMPLCGEHTEIYYQGYKAGQIATAMDYMDAYPEIRKGTEFENKPELVHEVAMVSRHVNNTILKKKE